MEFIPYALPMLGKEEISEVVDTLESGWLTTGQKTKDFETQFASYVGADFALAVNSATAGLHLALEALGVGPGDKVITTVHTFTATAEVIRYLGADPVFVDIEGDSFNIDVDEVKRAIEEYDNVKVIIPVHYAGQAANIDKLMDIAKQYGIKILEDAAHALPTTHNGKMVGTMGDITVFSFYANKTITTGEGGMIVTNNPEYKDRMSCMRLHGISRDVFDRFTSKKPSWHYSVVAPGYKYNLTDIASSIGIHQLKKADALKDRREVIAKAYNNGFKDLPIKTPHVVNPEDVHSWHLYVVQLDLESLTISRERFIELMSEAGIGTSVHYIPLHRQPYWKENYDLDARLFPKSEHAYSRIVSLPNYPKMSDGQVERVIEAVKTILMENIKSA
ncbi:DegT/DnrJ/EryC1/StrS family aminotransferase [Pseudoalteromonas apostichopi]|uniref:DegT/DnrJ/EryC1/StrS family aminotransferase n=1 Tax=Pseudoalteromonas apostichopi TaxID=3035452 RepID=UPI002574710B|nr:DegT/DnrJ/EryC1/StrS family aminotransferase [Pseudoalteromonas sp. FE4]